MFNYFQHYAADSASFAPDLLDKTYSIVRGSSTYDERADTAEMSQSTKEYINKQLGGGEESGVAELSDRLQRTDLGEESGEEMEEEEESDDEEEDDDDAVKDTFTEGDQPEGSDGSSLYENSTARSSATSYTSSSPWKKSLSTKMFYL